MAKRNNSSRNSRPFEERVVVATATTMPEKLDALAVMLFEEQSRDVSAAPAVDLLVEGALGRALALRDFAGKAGTLQSLPASGKAPRLLLAGAGSREAADIDNFRWAGAAVSRAARTSALAHVAMPVPEDLPDGITPDAAAEALAEGFVLGAHNFDRYKPEAADGALPAKPTPAQVRFTLVGSGGNVSAAARVGATVARAANYARTLASTPGNIMHPLAVVAEAQALARRTGLHCTVFKAATLAQMGMQGLTSVGQGSPYPPALAILEHRGPRGRGASAKPVVLVGKTITFDTGGISIKPAADMDAMKYDKCGGMAVLGIMRAASELRLPHRVIGVLPIAENAVGGEAYRPGDILTMYNGKTVEITNTDAEGRLVLADALAYAAEKFAPRAMIDMATLTGGVVTALGGVYGGLMANDDTLAAALEAAGQASGEWLWRLPLHQRYEPLMEGYHANLQNSGGREAHPVQGGIFLQHFVPKGMPWAHLDIAGTATVKKDERYLARGASGYGVRLLVRYLRDLKH